VSSTTGRQRGLSAVDDACVPGGATLPRKIPPGSYGYTCYVCLKGQYEYTNKNG
jgi:hypothetical protein